MVLRRKALIAGGALLALLALAALMAWVQRNPIATEIIDNYLADKGVIGRYDVTAIGTKRQRLENISIGDPDNPDLTADWVEVDVSPRLSGVEIKAVRASGVRLRAKVAGGKISFGLLDKLLPPPTNEPFKWPDLDLQLGDARARIDTPWGQFGARLDGVGNPSRIFDGRLALASSAVRGGGCAGRDFTLVGRAELRDGATHFTGPLKAAAAGCGVNGVTLADTTLDVRTDSKFNNWSGRIGLAAQGAAAAGATMVQPQGLLDFTWRKAPGTWTGRGMLAASSAKLDSTSGQGAKLAFDLAGTTSAANGKADMTLTSLATPQMRGGATALSGDLSLARDPSGQITAQSGGTLSLSNAVPEKAVLSFAARLPVMAKGTPVEPLAAQLAASLSRLSTGGDAEARYTLAHIGGTTRLALSGVDAKSRSGARLTMAGSDPVLYTIPGGLRVSGTTQVSGGGLPATVIRWQPSAQGLAGTASIAAMSAGAASLALTPVRFSMGRSGLMLDTQMRLSGPLGSAGRIDGLSVPIAIAGGGLRTTGCLPVRYESVRYTSLTLSPGQISTCLTQSGATLTSPRIAGRMGGDPITARANRITYGFARKDFAVQGLALSLGGIERQSQLDAVSLTGALTPHGASGRFTGAAGQLANVPLLLSEGNGAWRFAGGALSADGGLRVADGDADPRFKPLITRDFTLRFADGKITASASAREVITDTLVSTVNIDHELKGGTGSAVLDVPGINFGPTLQPGQLTRLTLGVIANVQGAVAGKGVINWSPSGVKSTGSFGTDDLNLAAAFGPVTGLKGQINLSDLLNMETAPGQMMSIGTINPGILINRGDVRYQLLPGKKVGIEGGRWPVAGGFLVLEPTVLDLGEEAERRLTFKVEGLDAGTFIQQMEFGNVSATGTFSGVLPMIFDKDGGRVEGGYIEAQEGGGTLSYVGEISRENLGPYGSMAFDALKSMQYRRLRIELGGPLDGEMVTLIKFAGINRAPVGASAIKLPIKVIGLSGFEFIFNISITAPFRRMMWMARSFEDPSSIIGEQISREQRRVKAQDAARATAIAPVQPPASGRVP